MSRFRYHLVRDIKEYPNIKLAWNLNILVMVCALTSRHVMSTITCHGMSTNITSHNVHHDYLIRTILIYHRYQVSMISINKLERCWLSRHFHEYQVSMIFVMIVDIVKSSLSNVEYKCTLSKRLSPFSNIHMRPIKK